MQSNLSHNGYSATVRLRLESNGRVVPLAQVVPHWIISTEPDEISPSPAIVLVEIDETENRRPVHFVDGISPASEFIAIVPRDGDGNRDALTD